MARACDYLEPGVKKDGKYTPRKMHKAVVKVLNLLSLV
jgi:hypothetical protein